MEDYGKYSAQGVCVNPRDMANACQPVETIDGWEKLESGMEKLCTQMGWLIQQASAIENRLLPQRPCDPDSGKVEESFGFFARMERAQERIWYQQKDLETILTRIAGGRA